MRGVTLLVVAAAVSVASVDVWWESAVVYQIYPRSFKDSDGDGIGDLNGITSKLSYLAEIGVDAIWLSPIYKSPMYDFGYDIADYKDIAAEYGTLADFDNLVAAAKNLSVRVVLDYVPNHTSNESDWFNRSLAREDKYTDYYIWANGTTDADGNRVPPSNWISVFRKSAWEFKTERGQYYLHQFVIGQPDINYRNADLREEMKDVLRFWLDRGVSGFRVDAVNFLYEVDPADFEGRYPDEPLSGSTTDTESYDYLNHTYTKDLSETFNIVYDWRDVLDNYTNIHNESKIMMTEAYTDLASMMRYYGDGTRDGSIPFNFAFLGEITSTSTASNIKSVIDKWMTNMPAGKVANWVNGNHDNNRLATRLGIDRVDAMNMLALILPGVSITYQGEELGMTNGNVSWKDTKDPQACNTDDPINYWKTSRDPARTPFHWDATTSAGFSTNNSTWLPVADNYLTVNVAVEMADNKSHYHFYKDVVALKHTSAVSTGALATYAVSDSVLVVTRIPAGDQSVVGIINLSSNTTVVNLTSIAGMPSELQVVASGVACSAEKGSQVTNSITMSGNCALALKQTSAVATTSTTVTPTTTTSTTATPTTTTSTTATPTTTTSTTASPTTTTSTTATPTTTTSTTASPPTTTSTTTTSTTTTAKPNSAHRFLTSFTLYSTIFLIYGYLQ